MLVTKRILNCRIRSLFPCGLAKQIQTNDRIGRIWFAVCGSQSSLKGTELGDFQPRNLDYGEAHKKEGSCLRDCAQCAEIFYVVTPQTPLKFLGQNLFGDQI